MVTVASDRDATRRLNHVEMVYRPGERELARRVFELLGLRVSDDGGTWMFARIDPAIGDVANNACYASEMTPEQWALEQALADGDRGRGDDARGNGFGSAWIPGAVARGASTIVPLRDPVVRPRGLRRHTRPDSRRGKRFRPRRACGAHRRVPPG